MQSTDSKLHHTIHNTIQNVSKASLNNTHLFHLTILSYKLWLSCQLPVARYSRNLQVNDAATDDDDGGGGGYHDSNDDGDEDAAYSDFDQFT